MTRSAWIVTLALGACHRTPSARERALAEVPREADLIAAADGAALASPAFRKAIDEIRPRVPPSFGCVIDHVLAADTLVLARDPEGIAVIAIAAPSIPCPALARIAPDLSLATIGAPGAASGAIDLARWQRARPFLLSAPIVLAVDGGDVHVIAGAQLDPAAAWLTIDASDARVSAAAEREAHAWLERLPESKLHVTRDGDQIRITLDGASDDELAALAEAGARLFDAAPSRTSALACPALDAVVQRCEIAGRHVAITVASIAAVQAVTASAAFEPVIENGEVIGVRATADSPLLERGDVVLAVDGQRVRSREELGQRVAGGRGRLGFDVRRGGTAVMIDVAASE